MRICGPRNEMRVRGQLERELRTLEGLVSEGVDEDEMSLLLGTLREREV